MYLNLVKHSKVLLVSATLLVSVITKATTCPNAIVIPGGTTFPTPATALTCGTTNDITSANSTACGSASYKGGLEALYMYTPSTNITGFTVAYNGVSYVGITIYQGCPTSGGTCLTSVATSATTKTTTAISLTAGTTYYIMFDTWPSPASPCPGTFILNGTPPPPCTALVYGASVAGDAFDDEIFNVTLGTLNNTSSCTSLAGGAGSVLKRYSNYSGIVAAPSITKGLSYPLSVTVGQCDGSAYGGNVTVYIDYNQNGLFTDAGEMVYASPYTTFAVAGTAISSSIIIPTTALTGTTRMRVIAVEGSSSAYGPTATYSWGETEDYCVDIIPNPGCSGTPNAGIAAITSSVGCPGNAITLSATGLSTGIGLNLQWQSATASTGPWASITTGTTSSFATSTTTTTYYRLVSTCTTSALSATSSVVSYSVNNPGPCVCNAYPLIFSSTTYDEEISNVTVGSMNNSSTCSLAAGGAGSILNRYGNYSGIVTGPNQALGSAVSFSLTQTSCGGAYPNFFQIYVDWNQDGDWLDVGEQVYSQTASVNGNQTVTGSFTVPATAVLGTTRMRVVNVENTASTTNYAHTVYTYGETEDYCFTTFIPGCSSLTYGPSAAGSAFDDEIFNVTLGTLNNTSSCTTLAGGAGSILKRYSNYSGVIMPPSITQGVSYPLSVTVGQCDGTAYGGNVTVYIDYNQNGLFTDAGEMVYASPYTTFAIAGTAVSSSIIIPTTALTGTTRMRVIAVEGSSSAYGSTATYSWGETEDYCVTILPSPGCSGTPNGGLAVISAGTGCSGGVVNLSATGLSTGTGIGSQWQSATAATGPWANITGATASTYSFTSTVGSTFYRIVSTCTTSALSNTSTVVSFNGINCISTNVPATGSNTLNCGTSTKLYDNGGPTANYSTGNNGFTVLNNTGAGIITISGTYLNIESCCDYVKIYSGAGIGGTLLYTYAGSGTMTTFSSTPGQILTVQLYSDGSVEGEGFDMNVIYTNYVAPTPTITIAGTPVICAGATTSLTASGAATYTWTGLGSTNPLSVTPSAATIYSVTGSACGVNSAPVTYTVAVSASPSITVNSGAICSGSSFTMAPTGGTTYTYTGGSAVVSPTTNATYTVTSSNVSGCIGSAISTVTVNARPIVSLLAGGVICPGDSYTLVANGATTYTYSSGSAVVSPTATTTYSVTGTNTLGCISSNTATTSVTVTSGPSITVNSGAICPGGSFTMTPTGGTTYTYTGGSAIVSPTSNATYTVTSANLAGCIGSAVSTVTVNANPSVTALASNTLICVGNSAVLTASTSATSYTWDSGATTMSITVSPTVTTTYTVNVTDVTTCSSSAVITVNVSTCTGINEQVAYNVNVYPNPTTGVLNITLTSELTKNSTLEIYDAIGKLIVTEVLSNELNTFNLSNLSNGIYTFKVLNNANMVKLGKLIKQ